VRSGLDACLHIWSYPERVTIVNEGDISNSLYLILEGKVKVCTTGEDGREAVFCTQGPGEYFGEAALADDQRIEGQRRPRRQVPRCLVCRSGPR
jgi:CRP/FNR family transcriptional regulator, cyclic AMP receptor protein